MVSLIKCNLISCICRNFTFLRNFLEIKRNSTKHKAQWLIVKNLFKKLKVHTLRCKSFQNEMYCTSSFFFVLKLSKFVLKRNLVRLFLLFLRNFSAFSQKAKEFLIWFCEFLTFWFVHLKFLVVKWLHLHNFVLFKLFRNLFVLLIFLTKFTIEPG